MDGRYVESRHKPFGTDPLRPLPNTLLTSMTYLDDKTYRQTFRRLRPFFWLLYKLDRVPRSFYLKFAGDR